MGNKRHPEDVSALTPSGWRSLVFQQMSCYRWYEHCIRISVNRKILFAVTRISCVWFFQHNYGNIGYADNSRSLHFMRYLKNHLFGIWEITAQCDAWFSALYKYSYLLTYLLTSHRPSLLWLNFPFNWLTRRIYTTIRTRNVKCVLCSPSIDIQEIQNSKARLGPIWSPNWVLRGRAIDPANTAKIP